MSFGDAHMCTKTAIEGRFHRALPRFSVGLPQKYPYAPTTKHLSHSPNMRGSSSIIAGQKLPDKSGEDTINRSSMAIFGYMMPITSPFLHRLRGNALACWLLVLVFLLIGCSSVSLVPAAPSATSTPALSDIHAISTSASRTYLGTVNGTRALLGIVINGSQFRAYACDGTPSRLATLSEWFAGQLSGSRVQANSPDRARLTTQLSGQSARGTLTLASGRAYTFSIPLIPTTARVGLFEGTALIGGQRYHAGWLLLPGGDQRGAASYYPSGPIRGQIVIALLQEFPTGPV